ncbi:hypothetical protein MRM63_06680 [bacterium 19MO03SA05]|uniref:Uncharacterized protein n=1 Tax=bacterium 19MO03SA05 TaxID=2920620 RepID=A0AAU6VGD7_UNCXX|nr:MULTISPECIES: hypothetical protein [unclassified Vibrio]EKO3922089.1 hypothetical protein [Vibrio metschnikovii]MDQ2107319.1 hypothetical protein [Vibrio sp. 2017_1457_15]MDQ2160131.1 hypothetical protein [Vibrio sp. 2017_1457_13]
MTTEIIALTPENIETIVSSFVVLGFFVACAGFISSRFILFLLNALERLIFPYEYKRLLVRRNKLRLEVFELQKTKRGL